jgi:hypothetical protein
MVHPQSVFEARISAPSTKLVNASVEQIWAITRMFERFRTAPAMSPQLGVICRNQPRLLAQVDRVFLSRIVVLCTVPGCVSSRKVSLCGAETKPVVDINNRFRVRKNQSPTLRYPPAVSEPAELYDSNHGRHHPCRPDSPRAYHGQNGSK